MSPRKNPQNKYPALVLVWIVIASILTLGKVGFANNLKSEEIPPSTVSQQRYGELKEQYLLIVNTKGPDSAVNQLKMESEKDPATLYYCHDLMHDIGKAAIVNLKDFSKAAAFQDATCVSGYIHGVLQEYFSTATDVYKAMGAVCDEHKKENYYAWECYHGVGHGLMYYSENNLPESIERCTIYPELFARSACTNGVYMENFTADEKSHSTVYRKPQDPFYPCRVQKEEYKSGCYQSAPIYYLSLNNYDYKSALEWCKDAGEDFRRICYSGIGSQAVRRNVQNIKFVESICKSGDNQQKSWCIAGMINYYIGHYGSIEIAEELCSKFDRKNQRTCTDAILLYARMYN